MGNTKFDTPRRAKIRGTVEFCEAHGLFDDKKITKRDIFQYFGVRDNTGQKMLGGRHPKRRCIGLDSGTNEMLWACSDPDSRTIENDPRYHTKRLQPQYWHGLAPPHLDTDEDEDFKDRQRLWRQCAWGEAQERFAWLDLATPAGVHIPSKSRIKAIQAASQRGPHNTLPHLTLPG